MKRKINIRNKLLNLLNVHGKKRTVENILCKSFKEIQKQSQKAFKLVMQLSLINMLPIFKLHKIEIKNLKKKKKQIKHFPVFISHFTRRVWFSIKIMLKSLKNRKSTNYVSSLKKTLLLSSQNKEFIINFKNVLQEEVLVYKQLFLYYRW